jgi:hypothetical protein
MVSLVYDIINDVMNDSDIMNMMSSKNCDIIGMISYMNDYDITVHVKIRIEYKKSHVSYHRC